MTPILIQGLPILNFSLGILLTGLSLGFLVRIVMTWYPQDKFQAKTWLLFVLPTEPLLSLTRKFIPPIGGVDITPVIWFGLISLIRELLVGQQGIISQIITNTHSL